LGQPSTAAGAAATTLHAVKSVGTIALEASGRLALGLRVGAIGAHGVETIKALDDDEVKARAHERAPLVVVEPFGVTRVRGEPRSAVFSAREEPRLVLGVDNALEDHFTPSASGIPHTVVVLL
jgi:hypothetical protein